MDEEEVFDIKELELNESSFSKENFVIEDVVDEVRIGKGVEVCGSVKIFYE